MRSSPSPSLFKLIRNERRKLTATWMNALSAAAIAVGGFAQVVQVLNGAATMQVGTFSLVWFSSGLIIHWGARLVLGRLEE